MTGGTEGAFVANPPSLGLSSASMPAASSAELAATTLRGGGNAVDLRIGKGHGWEASGVSDGIAAAHDAGVRVAFVGTGWVLGRPGHELRLPGAEGIPVKVFLDADPDVAVLEEQAGTAEALGLPLWAETHRGGPCPAQLARLAAGYGIGVVVDLLGLYETSGGQDVDDGALAALAPHVRAVQVKGFSGGPNNRPRHRPLSGTDLDVVLRLLDAGASVASITVESRAGTPVNDLRLLAGVLSGTTRNANNRRGER